jgi:hypothetical protein
MLTRDSHDVLGERPDTASRVDIERYGIVPLLFAVAPQLSQQSIAD